MKIPWKPEPPTGCGRWRIQPLIHLSGPTAPPSLMERIVGQIGRLPHSPLGYRRLVRSFQTGALPRNECEMRLGRLLILTGHCHALAAVLLLLFLSKPFPIEGIPLWLRWQPWVGGAMGGLLVAGGLYAIGWAKDSLGTGRRFLSVYTLLLGGDGLFLLWHAAPSAGSLGVLGGGLASFFLLEVVAQTGQREIVNRRKAWLP